MTNSIDPGGVASTADLPLDQSGLAELLKAVKEYFELMHDCDLSRFDRVFAPTVQLHGFRDSAMVCWSAQAYRDILAKRRSPKSQGSPRADEILLIDLAAATQAFVKVRVRITSTMFVDYLTWHRIDGRWLITSKGFHLERVLA